MGRYPLMAAAEAYLERRKIQVGESTWDNDRRIVKSFVSEIEQMREDGRIKTTHPRDIGPVEVRAFLEWMRDPKEHKGKSLDPDTQVRYLSKLDGILRMNGNCVIETMRDEGFALPQKVGRKPIRAISTVDLEAVQEAAQNVGSCRREPEGWRRAKSTLLMKAYVATGLRPSELRLSFMEDLDTRKWRIYVRTPKGAGVWAGGRTVTIMPPYRQGFIEYLQERENLLRFYGRSKATYLIPNLRDGKDSPYSSNHFRELKKEVQEISGIDFKLKDFRSTFATLCVEMDPNLLIDVSAQLGHAGFQTTQRFYAQISAESAGSRLEKAWEKNTNFEQNDKSTKSEIVLGMLMQALGINTAEDLQRMIPSQISQESKTPRIENKPDYIR